MEKPKDNVMGVLLETEMAKMRAFDECIKSRWRFVRIVATVTILGAMGVFFWVLSEF